MCENVLQHLISYALILLVYHNINIKLYTHEYELNSVYVFTRHGIQRGIIDVFSTITWTSPEY